MLSNELVKNCCQTFSNYKGTNYSMLDQPQLYITVCLTILLIQKLILSNLQIVNWNVWHYLSTIDLLFMIFSDFGVSVNFRSSKDKEQVWAEEKTFWAFRIKETITSLHIKETLKHKSQVPPRSLSFLSLFLWLDVSLSLPLFLLISILIWTIYSW